MLTDPGNRTGRSYRPGSGAAAYGATRARSVDGLLRSHARVDVLVNNAGLQHVAPIERYPLERVAEAYEQMHSGKARFRVVLIPGI